MKHKINYVYRLFGYIEFIPYGYIINNSFGYNVETSNNYKITIRNKIQLGYTTKDKLKFNFWNTKYAWYVRIGRLSILYFKNLE